MDEKGAVIMVKSITTIRTSIEERRYAKALSRKLGGCRLKEGSAAYAFRFLLHREAKRENVPLGDIYTSHLK